MKDLRKATITIANASNKEQAFVPYAQSFLYKLAPQDAIQFPANSVQAIYYQKQNQGPIAAQAIGEDDVKVICGTFDGTSFTKSEDYMYVGEKIVGEIPYETNEVIGFGEGNRICLHFVNPTITSKDELPEGIICRTLDTRTEQGYNEYTKDAFEDDGSLIYIANMQNLKKWVDIDWGDGFVRYDIDCSKAKLEAKGETPQPTTYSIDDSGIQNGYNSGDTTIEENGTATITIVANSGYVIPQTIAQENITGATYNDDYDNGTFTISNPTSDVDISCVCEAEQPTTYNIDDSGIENGSNVGDTTIQENGTATITIQPYKDYVVPQTITQENVAGATYNNDYNNGTFTISNPTGDVVITCVCESEQPQPTLTLFKENDQITTGQTICQLLIGEDISATLEALYEQASGNSTVLVQAYASGQGFDSTITLAEVVAIGSVYLLHILNSKAGFQGIVYSTGDIQEYGITAGWQVSENPTFSFEEATNTFTVRAQDIHTYTDKSGNEIKWNGFIVGNGGTTN